MPAWTLMQWRLLGLLTVCLLILGAGRILAEPLFASPVSQPLIVQTDCPPSAPPVSDPDAEILTPSTAAPSVPNTGLVDVNTTPPDVLQTLPGIGPVLAERIVAYRETWGPFTHPVDLLEVSGIGPRVLERLQEFVTVGQP